MKKRNFSSLKIDPIICAKFQATSCNLQTFKSSGSYSKKYRVQRGFPNYLEDAIPQSGSFKKQLQNIYSIISAFTSDKNPIQVVNVLFTVVNQTVIYICIFNIRVITVFCVIPN